MPHVKEKIVKRLQADIPLLPTNLRFFARQIRNQKDVYNKFWRKLIVDSLEFYANKIDGIIQEVKIEEKIATKELKIPLDQTHVKVVYVRQRMNKIPIIISLNRR